MMTIDAIDIMGRYYQTSDEFWDEFPVLKKYITECKNTEEKIIRINKVIVNIRNELWWKSKDTGYEKYIVQMNRDENLFELTNFDHEPLLIMVLKCVTNMLNYAMDVLDEENGYEDMENIYARRRRVLKLAKK